MSLFHNKLNELSVDVLPKHIGIIMDGNGRWAQRLGVPRHVGHSRGAKVFKTITSYCGKLGIEVLTVYAFSTENWKRPKKEVDAIMDLFKRYLVDSEKYKRENIRVKIIGDRSVFDGDMKTLIDKCEANSRNFTGMTLNIAVNYGGRAELVNAVKTIINKAKDNKLSQQDVNEEYISQLMYTAGQPDPDIIIRSGGESRLSNFLVWQSSYSELIFTKTLWPDFTTKHIDDILRQYAKRHRRFGGI